MKILVGFKNPKTGEIRHVKCGWSWTLFLWSGVLGLPLFLRKLHVWGMIFLTLWVVNLLSGPFGYNEAGNLVALFFVFLGLQLWLGLRGNEMTAKNYLEHNWALLEPDSEFTRLALRQWGISTPDSVPSSETTAIHNPTPPKATSSLGKVLLILSTIIITVIAMSLLMHILKGMEHSSNNTSTSQNTNAVEPSRHVPEWTIRREKDKFTDKQSIAGYRVFELENGQIQASVTCLDEKIPLFNIPEHLEGIKFEFDYFVNGDDEGKKPESSYENERDPNNYLLNVVFPYRLDSNEAKEVVSKSKYRNQVFLPFYTKESSELMMGTMALAGVAMAPVLPNEDLKNSQILRVRLPIVGRQPADLEIKLSDLYEVLASCSPTKTSNVPDDKKQHLPTETVVEPISKVESTRSVANAVLPACGSLEVQLRAKDAISGGQAILEHWSETGASMETRTCSAVLKLDSESKEINFKLYWVDKSKNIWDLTSDNSSYSSLSLAQGRNTIDCNSSRLPMVDLLVCSNQDLLRKDAQLNGLYQSLLKRLDQSTAVALKKNQKQWYDDRSKECEIRLGDISEQESSHLILCLQGLYSFRIGDLQTHMQ